MKIPNLLRNNGAESYWLKFAVAGLLALSLAGCGSSDDGGTPAAGGAGGAIAPPATAAAAITTAAAVVANDTATNPTSAFAVVQDAGVPVVSINSPPKINFTVIDNGAVFKTLTPGSNARFTLAKLVRGANGDPDKWQSYTYRTRESEVTPGTNVVQEYAVQDADGEYSTADNLVYNEAGYYTFTYPIDITDDTLLTPGVTYDSAATHRIAVQLRYTNSAGTDVRTQSHFDFTIDASGNAVAVTDSSLTRKVVDVSSCNECHSALRIHGGRTDTQYCVMCHTPGTTDEVTGNVVDFKIMVHKIHFGEHAKELFGEEYKVQSANFGEVLYPQPIANCVKCHDNTKAAQADNWKSVPSIEACGSCHSGISFATGKGVSMADAHEAAEADKAVPGSGDAIRAASLGHIGGSKADNSQCTICHGAADVPVYHVTVDPKGSEGRGAYNGKDIPLAAQMNLPAGVHKIDFEIKQVTVDGAAGAKKASVVYRIMVDGAPATLNTAVGSKLIDNLDGTPDIYVAYGVQQDGIAAPADWNTYKSAHINAIRDGTDGSQTGPDADGYYTATLSAAGDTIPDDATHVTAAVGINYGGFVQLGLTAYPDGIRLRPPKFAMKAADGYTPRRSIVSADKCNACHAQLGVAPSFHSGARNNGEGCAICHDANRATSHGGGWNVGVKNLIHGIHGASKREQDFTYEASATNPKGFGVVTYPGILKNCEQCHVEGSYDFSGTDNKAALPNLLWTSDANDDESATADVSLSPWLTALASGKADYSADNLVSSPIASACFGCHDSSDAVAHMKSNGGSIYARFSSVASVATRPAEGAASTMTFTTTEQCMFCHASDSTYGLGIKAVHAK